MYTYIHPFSPPLQGLEVSKGRIFQTGPGPAWNEMQNFGPDPARPIFFPISAQTAWFKWF